MYEAWKARREQGQAMDMTAAEGQDELAAKKAAEARMRQDPAYLERNLFIKGSAARER